MIDIRSIKIAPNTELGLPDDWKSKMEDLLNTKDLSSRYKVVGVDSHKHWELQSLDGLHTISMSNIAVKYLLGQKVESKNTGFKFKEYLPDIDTDLILTAIVDEHVVIVGKIVIDCILLDNTCLFDFRLVDVCDNSIIKIDYAGCYSWKELDNMDISEMTDTEKLMQDTFMHKKYVMMACNKMIDYLEKHGIYYHAAMLKNRALMHDDSKFKSVLERQAFSEIINDRSCLLDPDVKMSQPKVDCIKIHWKHNSHHPEFYENPEDMTKLDILEMVCDWYARSLQYNTDLLDFAYKRQRDRFHFPEYMFNEIIHYCKVLIG